MSNEFDFIGDEAGGYFAPVGGVHEQLRSAMKRGDVDGAVKLYEESAASAREAILEDMATASFENRKQWANMLMRARDFRAAAKVYELARLEAAAASCHEKAGDFALAAAASLRGGELMKAAAAYERAGQPDEAIALYTQAGAREALAECLARQDRGEEAAVIFRELENTHAEVEVLRSALRRNPSSVTALCRLADVFVAYGHVPQAIDLLMGAAKASEAIRSSAVVLELLAKLLETTGQVEGAAKVRARLAGLTPAANVRPNVPPILQRTAGPADGYAFLKALPMFSELSLDDMKSLYRICSGHSFAAGQHLIEPGQPGRGLFVIIDGQVEVFGGPDQSSRLLNTLGVGSYVGEMSLVRDTPTSARVTTRTPVRALFMGREAFTQFLFNTPTAALSIYKLFTVNLAERVRVLSAAR